MRRLSGENTASTSKPPRVSRLASEPSERMIQMAVLKAGSSGDSGEADVGATSRGIGPLLAYRSGVGLRIRDAGVLVRIMDLRLGR